MPTFEERASGIELKFFDHVRNRILAESIATSPFVDLAKKAAPFGAATFLEGRKRDFNAKTFARSQTGRMPEEFGIVGFVDSVPRGSGLF